MADLATVYTFYSYKGGVGRSMAMANVGQWFCRLGANVVLVDWDLEAPGLEAFFYGTEEEREEARAQPGLIDLLLAYIAQLAHLGVSDSVETSKVVDVLESELPPVRPLLRRVEPAPTAPRRGSLWLLTAGRRAGDRFSSYAEAVQGFNWSEFYARYHGEAFIEWLRRQLADPSVSDAVLIDSRTGVTEMGGVCTQQLADVVVGFCAPNNQNVRGLQRMAASFQRREIREARGGRPIEIVAVPARIEASELDKRNEFHRLFVDLLDGFVPPAFRTVNPAFSFWELRIPYVAKYSYEETLVIGAPDAAEEIQEAYKNLATQLARLDRRGVLPRAISPTPEHVTTTEPGALAVWNVPTRTLDFVNRVTELADLEKALDPKGGGRTVVLTGIGGVGKTALALEHVHRHRGDYQLVWWIGASDPAAVTIELAGIAEAVGLPAGTWDLQRTAEYAQHWLNGNDKWLLVIDDADGPDALTGLVPRGAPGQILITSRNPSWRGTGTVVPLDSLGTDEAVELLVRRTGQDDREAASELARSLGGLPLALAQAGSYLEETGRSYEDFVRLLRERPETVLSGDLPVGASSESVMQAWEPSFDALPPDALELLNMLSLLASEEIPFDLFSAPDKPLFGPLDKLTADPLALDGAVATLRRHSFVTAKRGAVSVHPLVQLVTRVRLPHPELDRAATAAVTLLQNAFPEDGFDVRTWPRAARLVPHVLALGDRIVAGGTPQRWGDLMARAGQYQLAHGEYDAALRTLDEAMRSADSASQPWVAFLTATALIIRGDRVELARDLLAQAVPTFPWDSERRWAVEAALTVAMLATGQPQAAIAKARELADRFPVPSPTPLVLWALVPIVDVIARGDRDEARALLERWIDPTVTGPQELRLTLRYARLVDDPKRTIQLLRPALDASEDLYGRSHSVIGDAQFALAEAYRAVGYDAEAEAQYVRALGTTSRALGPLHSRTKTIEQRLAELVPS